MVALRVRRKPHLPTLFLNFLQQTGDLVFLKSLVKKNSENVLLTIFRLAIKPQMGEKIIEKYPTTEEELLCPSSKIFQNTSLVVFRSTLRKDQEASFQEFKKHLGLELSRNAGTKITGIRRVELYLFCAISGSKNSLID